MNESVEWIYDDAELKKLSEDFINQYADEKLTKRGAETYNCPFCGSGTKSKGTPAFHYSHTKKAYHCFSCGERGHDLYYLIGAVEGIDGYQNRIKRAMEYSGVQLKKHRNPDYNGSIPWDGEISDDGYNSTKAPAKARQSAGNAAGVSLNGPKPAEKQPKVYIPEIEDTPKINFTPEVLAAHAALKNAPVALDYYHSRGLSDEIIERYKLGYWQAGYNDLLKNHPGNHAGGWKQKLYSYVLPYPSVEDGKYTYFLTEIRDRRQVDEYNDKYRKITKKETGIAAELFNERYLMQETQPEVVFICEGIYDALSVEMCGGYAIAFVGTAHQRFLKLCRTYKPKTRFVISLDNDGPGADSTKRVIEGLDSLRDDYEISIPYIVRTAPDGKDYNDSLQADPAALKKYVRDVVSEVKAAPLNAESPETAAEAAEDPETAAESPQTDAAGENEESTAEAAEDPETAAEAAEEARLKALREYCKETNVYTYMPAFLQEIADSVNNPPIKTGFKELDKILDGGLYGGSLIGWGAISSCGKTAICMQIADQIAAGGTDVIIFSLEMGRGQLVARSVSRLTMLDVLKNGRNRGIAKTSHGISAGHRYERYSAEEHEVINHAIAAYQKIGRHIFIHEGVGNIGVKDVRESVEKHITLTGRNPVVIVDYLQIIAPSDPRASDKQNTDKAVTELKRLARDHNIPVVIISSFNRENYKTSASMQAFKESGSIEYSTDVLIGMQLKGTGEKDFDVEAEKEKNPREIELKILKNRDAGVRKKPVEYEYYPMFNLFREVNSDFVYTTPEDGVPFES